MVFQKKRISKGGFDEILMAPNDVCNDDDHHITAEVINQQGTCCQQCCTDKC